MEIKCISKQRGDIHAFLQHEIQQLIISAVAVGDHFMHKSAGVSGFEMLLQHIEISDLLQRIFVGFNAGADKRLQQQSSFVVELFVELTRTVVRAGIGHDQELFTHKLLYIRTVI